jgi:hypothetical protein
MTGSTPRKRGRKQALSATEFDQLLAAGADALTDDLIVERRRRMSRRQAAFYAANGPKADTVCAYKQGTHWAFLDMLTMLESNIDARDFVLRALLERIGRLEAQIGQQRSVIYRGVFDAAEQYEPGSMVTHGGSVWHANEATSDAPGGSSAWTLAVRRGRDGKDAR